MRVLPSALSKALPKALPSPRYLAGSLMAFAALLLTGCGGGNMADYADHGWGIGICGMIVLIMDIVAIIEVAGSDRTFGGKALWVALIFFFPVGGLLLYYFFGR